MIRIIAARHCGNNFLRKEEIEVKKQKIPLIIAAVIFTVFEGLMFYFIHIDRPDTEINLYYACIIGAALFSSLTLILDLIEAKATDKSAGEVIFSLRNGNLIRIAMLFTLVADYYLVALKPPIHLTGVSVFLGTQLFICLHILANDGDRRAGIIHIAIRLIATAIIVAVCYATLGEGADALAIISVVYYGNLCVNALFAHRSGRGGVILTVGLILFALCDINVGLARLNDMYVGGFPEGSLPYELLHTDLDLVWIFYIPSQTLIPLSLLRTSNNK